MSLAPNNYRNVLSVVKQVSQKCARSACEVKLLVVSKTKPADVMLELYNECGIREFAENRIPELAAKVEALPKDIKWHFIGPIQSNKLRKIVQYSHLIHSIASIDHIAKLDRISKEEGKTPEFLLEVNISGEASKGGLRPDELFDAAASAINCTSAKWRGLMTMAPIDADDDLLNEIFSSLAGLKAECEEKFSIELPELSMGMSGDFPIAIACGATIVRVGSRIFEGV